MEGIIFTIDIEKEIHVDFPRSFLPKQMEVFESCKKETAILYSGAFRAGKTLLLCHVAIDTCLENPGCKGLIGALTYTQLNNVVFGLFVEELDRYQAELEKAGYTFKLAKKVLHSQTKMMVEFYNGSIVYFRACDDERKLAGYTLDFFGLDEPIDMDEAIFSQLLGRISGTGNLKNRFGLLTTNPGNETHWIYKYFYLMREQGFKHIDTTTYDNLLLPDYDNYIQRLERTWDEDWVRRYLNGTWGMFEGAIYKEFNPDKHMGDYRELPVKYHICGIDWGLRNPYAILVGGVTEDDRIVIKEERYGTNKSSHELAKDLATLHKEYKFKKAYCDPSAADLIFQSYNLGVPIGKRSGGAITSFADNDVDSGISRMKSLFKNNMILVDKSCHFFKREHMSYRYQEGKEKPIKKDDHTCDAARYLTTDFNPYVDDDIFEVVYWKMRKWI